MLRLFRDFQEFRRERKQRLEDLLHSTLWAELQSFQQIGMFDDRNGNYIGSRLADMVRTHDRRFR